MNWEFCQYLIQNWVYIHQTSGKDVTLHVEFSQMISFSLQGIVIIKIQEGGHFVMKLKYRVCRPFL